jgi:hypothetical protein
MSNQLLKEFNRDGIISLDETMFELGTLKALETFVPTEEEMEQIKDYLKTGDIKMLGKAEQYFVLVSSLYV